MKKKIILLAALIIIISVSIILFQKKSPANVIAQNEDLKSRIESTVSTAEEINFSDITNFNWDQMYIITPYGDPNAILANENIKWKEIDTSIKVKDDIALIIFLNKGDIVSYLNYPRKNGDFKIQKSTKFDKNLADFKITKTNTEINIIPK